MSTENFVIGATIRVTTGSGLFNRDRLNKTGRIVRVNPISSIISVEFDDGTTDYGYMSNAVVITATPKEGDRVRVVSEDGGVFLSRFEGKEGTVVSVDDEDDTVTVEFDCGNRDYGNFGDVVLVETVKTPVTTAKRGDVASNGMTVGDTVRVNADPAQRGSFYTRLCGKQGVIEAVLSSDASAVRVKFEDGTVDVGYIRGLELVARGPASGWIANTGSLPVPQGTLIDVKYKDGLVMLNVAAGVSEHGDSVILEGTGKNRRFARHWDIGNGCGTITHYRLALPAAKGRVVPFEEMRRGMKVRYIGQVPHGGHGHWGFVVGKVYECVDGGLRADSSSLCRTNYGQWSFELVEQASLSEQLADLREQMNAIKTEKQAAEAEVAAARTKVNEIEARRVALVATLTQHGIQFIAE